MKARFLQFTARLAKLHQANISLQDLGQVLEHSKNKEGLSFLPKTYADAPVQPFGGLIPTLSTSLERPLTFLSMFRSTIKALSVRSGSTLSVRSGSTLSDLGKTNAIVYYVSTQKFVNLAKNDIPRKSTCFFFSSFLFWVYEKNLKYLFRRLTLRGRCTSPQDPEKWHDPRHLSAYRKSRRGQKTTLHSAVR